MRPTRHVVPRVEALLLRRRPGTAGPATRRAGDRVPVDPAGVLRATGAERDLVATQPATGDRRGAERAFDLLELLRQRERVRPGLPRALDLRRHDPQVRRAPAGAVAADRL